MGEKTNSLIDQAEEHLIHSYNRYQIVFDHGDGMYLYDVEGEKYLDFAAGIAVCSLGYNNKTYNEALKNQVDKAIHYSNYFYSEPLVKATANIAKVTGMDKAFITNSGTEANEGAIKLARKYALMKGYENRYEIISMNKAFHGRSMGALSVTGTPKYREPFEPLIGGVKFADFNDIDSVKANLNENTCAIIMETVQGEGGIYPADKDFVKAVSQLCKENDILLILDEVQCGIGRTGTMMAYEQYGIEPDVVTVAKGIGNGIAVGAFAAKENVAKAMVPGDHGSTFGGNPLGCAAINAVCQVFEENDILANVKETGAYLVEELNKLKSDNSHIKDVRGVGLMVGMEFDEPVGNICKKALDKNMIFITAGTNIIRFVPPLIVEKSHVDEMIKKLKEIIM